MKCINKFLKNEGLLIQKTISRVYKAHKSQII